MLERAGLEKQLSKLVKTAQYTRSHPQIRQQRASRTQPARFNFIIMDHSTDKSTKLCFCIRENSKTKDSVHSQGLRHSGCARKLTPQTQQKVCVWCSFDILCGLDQTLCLQPMAETQFLLVINSNAYVQTSYPDVQNQLEQSFSRPLHV